MESNNDIEKFYKLCNYYLTKNMQRAFAVPTITKLKETFSYVLIYLNIMGPDRSQDYLKSAHDYLCDVWFDEDEFTKTIARVNIQDKLILLLDYVESYLVDEIEKDMYGHGDKCYTSLFNDLDLVLRIKQEKYHYKFTSVHDLLVNGYYFTEEGATRFGQLAAFHTPEECPD